MYLGRRVWRSLGGLAWTNLYNIELTWYLTRSSGPNFRLIVLQQPHKRSDQLIPHDELSNSLGKSNKFVGDHVPDSPALVRHRRPHNIQEVLLDLVRRQVLGECDEVGDGEESDRVLVIGGEFAVKREKVRDEKGFLAGDRCDRLGQWLAMVSSAGRNEVYGQAHA